MPPCILKEIIFLWSYSWGRVFTHAICNHIMTWLFQTYAYITSFPLLVIYTSFISFLFHDWMYYNHLDLLHSFVIIPYFKQWIPFKLEFLARHFLLPRNETSSQDSNGGSSLSSSCKYSFLMMYDEIYTRWLSSTHKYYLCF